MVYSRRLLPKLFMCVSLMGLTASQLQAIVGSLMRPVLRNAVGLTVKTPALTYKGLHRFGRFGRGNVLEGALDAAALWSVAYLGMWAKHYYRGTGIVKPFKAQIDIQDAQAVPGASLNVLRDWLVERDGLESKLAHIKQMFNTPDHRLFRGGLCELLNVNVHATDDVIRQAIENKVRELRRVQESLSPYLTIGSSLGVTEQVNVPFMRTYPNRFYETLETLGRECLGKDDPSICLDVKNTINSWSFDQLQRMDQKVQNYLQSWNFKRMGWMALTMKPSYTHAAQLYWNATFKIAYLYQCASKLSIKLFPSSHGNPVQNNIYVNGASR